LVFFLVGILELILLIAGVVLLARRYADTRRVRRLRAISPVDVAVLLSTLEQMRTKRGIRRVFRLALSADLPRNPELLRTLSDLAAIIELTQLAPRADRQQVYYNPLTSLSPAILTWLGTVRRKRLIAAAVPENLLDRIARAVEQVELEKQQRTAVG
jgi:hypothetical protein